MAKVLFYGATLPIATLKGWYDAGYKSVIFQLESADSDKWKDSYYLIAYPFNTDSRTLGDMLKLEPVADQPVQVHGRVLIGNLPLSQTQVEKFLAASGAINLLFTAKLPPEGKPKLKDYVVYNVQTRPVTVAELVEYELHPSPPAPPPAD